MKASILIISDEPSTRESVRGFLQGKKYNVLFAGDGLEGIQTLQEQFVHIVLMASTLPDMPVIEVLQQIRHVSPDTEVLLLVSPSTSPVTYRTKNVFGYVMQPVVPDYLLALLSSAIAKQRLKWERRTMAGDIKRLHLSSKRLSHSMDLDEIAQDALEQALDTVNASGGGIGCWMEPSNTLMLKAYRGIDEQMAQRLVSYLEAQDWLWELRARPFTWSEILKEAGSNAPAAPEDISPDTVILPLKLKDRSEGVLFVIPSEDIAFTTSRKHILATIGRQIAGALESAHLYEQAERGYQELSLVQEEVIQMEKLRALGEMAGGVAHNFNNVLAGILGMAQLSQLQLDDREKVESNLRHIERAALNAADMIKRIQEFASVRKDRQFGRADPNKLVEEVISMTQAKWKDSMRAAGISVQVKTELQSIPPVLGSTSELREVLTNMLFNAVDAISEHGTVTLKTWADEAFVYISVQDTGMGMSEDTRRHVFDPFFTTKGVEHDGLGLSVSSGIIRRHGGAFLVHSEEGKGSSFTIKLTATSVEEPEEIEPLEAFSARILLIEEEEPIREAVAGLLKLAGHKVEQADNGLKGMEKFRPGYFDIVFTDLSMPKLSGWQVAENLRKLDPAVIVVLLTGWGSEFEPDTYKKRGVDFMLSKPVNVGTLIHTVGQAMGLRKKRVSEEKTR